MVIHMLPGQMDLPLEVIPKETHMNMPVKPATKNTRATIDERVEQYVQIRDKIRELEKAHEEMIKPYKDALSGLNSILLQHLQKLGVESARTAAGTVYVTERTSASLADVTAFWDYVINTKEFDLIDKRANKTAVADYVKSNGIAPPGVNYAVTHLVGVRRA